MHVLRFTTALVIAATLIAATILTSGCCHAPPAAPASAMRLDQIATEQRDHIPPAAMERAFGYVRAHPDKVTNARYVTIIDFDQPSTARRMHVIDTATGRVEDLLVAHAKKSGDNFATQFSNAP